MSICHNKFDWFAVAHLVQSSKSRSTKMKLSSTIWLAVGILLVQDRQIATCENILFYFGMSGLSHVSTAYPLIEALADKGHNVTVMTPFPVNRTPKPGVNITTVVSTELFQLLAPMWDKDADLIGDRIKTKHSALMDTLFPAAIMACQIVISGPSTATMMYNSQFDLVIYDTTYNECAVGLARYKFNALYIAFSPASVLVDFPDAFGIPFEYSVIPDLYSSAPSPLTFYQKISSMFNSLHWLHKRTTLYYPALEELIQIKLGLGERPSLAELVAETSLVFINTHYTTDYPRALPPSFVPVGGLSILEERHPLPKDIKKFLSNRNDHGYTDFVYVSFGTAVRISKSNAEIRTKLFNAMGNSSLKFVWKWEDKIPAGVPDNIYFSNWLPQQDLLAHNGIKGMISHCGINGIQEAIYFGVPLIMFPIVGDQDYNAQSISSKGLGIKLEIATFTQEDLENAFREITTNEGLKSNVQRASKEFRDRPMTPLNTAVWWVEYVLRHKNTTSLKSLTRKQTWYEKRFLDVWFTIFVAVVTSACAAGLLIRLLYNFLTNTACNRNLEQKKRKQSSATKQLKLKSDAVSNKVVQKQVFVLKSPSKLKLKKKMK